MQNVFGELFGVPSVILVVPESDELLLLLLQLSDVVVSPDCSYFEHVFEFWVSFKNLVKIHVLEAVDFELAASLADHVTVVVSYLEDETDVANVGALVEVE